MDHLGRISQKDYHAALDRRAAREEEMRKRIAELEEALGKAIAFCDAALHGDNQYSDERSNIIRVWRGE